VAKAESDLRRVPSQERSKKRLEAILEAGAGIFAEAGFDAATMEAIAERADTSVGSLYQFFPNKRALFRAVADRSVARTGEAFTAFVANAPPAGDWRDLLDTMIDGFAELHGRDPFLRAVWSNLQLYNEFAEADQALEESMVDVITEVIGSYAPAMERARRKVVARVVVDVVGIMLLIAYRRGPKKEQVILDEVKLLIRRYLEPEVSR
jgi:AcrR family transcriptional regulator